MKGAMVNGCIAEIMWLNLGKKQQTEKTNAKPAVSGEVSLFDSKKGGRTK